MSVDNFATECTKLFKYTNGQIVQLETTKNFIVHKYDKTTNHK